MSLLQLPDNEPFAIGIDVPVQSPSLSLQRLEHFTLLFVRQGTAQVELDFRTYTLEPGRHIGLAANLYFQCLSVSPDFTVSYLTYNRDILLEVTRPFNPSFFAFLNQYPLSPALPDEWVAGNHRMMQFVYHIYKEKEHTFRLPIFKNCLQNFLMDIYDKTKAQFLHRKAGNSSTWCSGTAAPGATCSSMPTSSASPPAISRR